MSKKQKKIFKYYGFPYNLTGKNNKIEYYGKVIPRTLYCIKQEYGDKIDLKESEILDDETYIIYYEDSEFLHDIVLLWANKNNANFKEALSIVGFEKKIEEFLTQEIDERR